MKWLGQFDLFVNVYARKIYDYSVVYIAVN